MEQRISEEERTWNATQLQEALGERFGLGVTPEAVRQYLLALIYRWKRTRYVPSRQISKRNAKLGPTLRS